MSMIAPCLWFNGQAEEAAAFYTGLFPDSAILKTSRYGAGAPFPAGTALMVEFRLSGQRYQALNGGPHYPFSPALSLSIACPNTAVDRYWGYLTAAGGKEGRCGWLTDRFGVSWQVVPEGLGAALSDPDAGDDDHGEDRYGGDPGGGGRGMMNKATFDLAIERFIDAPPEVVWRVWTERLEEWWAPKPWTTRVIANDMRPNGRMGGRMALVMGGPDGAASEIEGVYLEVIPNKSIVFTNAFTAGWIPQSPFMVGFFAF